MDSQVGMVESSIGGFQVEGSSGNARAATLQTAHGEIKTPVFMPVGTQGTVKGVTAQMLRDVGAEMVLGNTYHLALRPGAEVVEALGGLQVFSGWRGPMLTDSGGGLVAAGSSSWTLDEKTLALVLAEDLPGATAVTVTLLAPSGLALPLGSVSPMST